MPVKIRWVDPFNDWPNFYLVCRQGRRVLLKGRDWPEQNAKHEGDSFWVWLDEIKSVELA